MTAQRTADAVLLPLQEGEQVIQVFRRHWLFLWPNILFLAVLGIAPVAVLAVVLSEAGALEGVVRSVFWLLALAWLLYMALRMFLAWYIYRHDVWVVTTQRLIDSYKRHPFNMRLATADLVNVQDMTVVRNGVLNTLLNFGDVVCQTAGEQQEIRISGVPAPASVLALVDRERDRERARIRG